MIVGARDCSLRKLTLRERVNDFLIASVGFTVLTIGWCKLERYSPTLQRYNFSEISPDSSPQVPNLIPDENRDREIIINPKYVEPVNPFYTRPDLVA
jgi:hypothetical protein